MAIGIIIFLLPFFPFPPKAPHTHKKIHRVTDHCGLLFISTVHCRRGLTGLVIGLGQHKSFCYIDNESGTLGRTGA